MLFLFGCEVQLLLDPFDIGVAVGDDLFGGQLRRAGLGEDGGLLLLLLLGGLRSLGPLRRLRVSPCLELALLGSLTLLRRLTLLGVLCRRRLAALLLLLPPVRTPVTPLTTPTTPPIAPPSTPPTGPAALLPSRAPCCTPCTSPCAFAGCPKSQHDDGAKRNTPSRGHRAQSAERVVIIWSPWSIEKCATAIWKRARILAVPKLSFSPRTRPPLRRTVPRHGNILAREAVTRAIVWTAAQSRTPAADRR